MSESKREITGILEEMTLDQVRLLRAEVVVLPIGSTEPHGPHLPYGTDTFQADAVSRRAADCEPASVAVTGGVADADERPL